MIANLVAALPYGSAATVGRRPRGDAFDVTNAHLLILEIDDKFSLFEHMFVAIEYAFVLGSRRVGGWS